MTVTHGHKVMVH